MTTNEKRWKNLLEYTQDLVDEERVEMGLDRGLFSHIYDEAENFEELLEALSLGNKTVTEIPRYVVFALNIGDYQGYLGPDEHGYLMEDLVEIENEVKRMVERGQEVWAYDLEKHRTLRLDIRMVASVRVME